MFCSIKIAFTILKSLPFLINLRVVISTISPARILIGLALVYRSIDQIIMSAIMSLPISEHGFSVYSGCLYFFHVLWFSAYKSCKIFVRFISKHFCYLILSFFHIVNVQFKKILLLVVNC